MLGNGAWDVHYYDIHYLCRLRMQGEIGLALAPGGPRPFGWTAEEVCELEDEGFLEAAGAPSDRAWVALTKGDREQAAKALADHEQVVSTLRAQWEENPKEGLVQILTLPSALFQLERRALSALVDRK